VFLHHDTRLVRIAGVTAKQVADWVTATAHDHRWAPTAGSCWRQRGQWAPYAARNTDTLCSACRASSGPLGIESAPSSIARLTGSAITSQLKWEAASAGSSTLLAGLYQLFAQLGHLRQLLARRPVSPTAGVNVSLLGPRPHRRLGQTKPASHAPGRLARLAYQLDHLSLELRRERPSPARPLPLHRLHPRHPFQGSPPTWWMSVKPGQAQTPNYSRRLALSPPSGRLELSAVTRERQLSIFRRVPGVPDAKSDKDGHHEGQGESCDPGPKGDLTEYAKAVGL
jgi:hypothetical protein